MFQDCRCGGEAPTVSLSLLGQEQPSIVMPLDSNRLGGELLLVRKGLGMKWGKCYFSIDQTDIMYK